MSVVGFDIGHLTCYVAVAKQGGIETIANEYSDRATPTCISLGENNRFIGASAKNQVISNIKNTVWGWKPLIGKKFKDEEVQRRLHSYPFEVVECEDGGVGIKVSYLNEKRIFTPVQLTAMMLTKLKETAEVNLKAKVVDCVISVPCYYTETERLAMLDASRIVGLNVLRLMNDTTATTLSYGIYKQDLPGVEEKARNVVFVDIGHCDMQVSACSFHKGKLKVLATVADASLGGSNVDQLLVEHFCCEFSKKYKLNVKSNPRAMLRLTQECERLKKLMSANTQSIPLGIECFMNDLDVTSSMERSSMEALCTHLLQRVEQHFQHILKAANLRPDDLHSVEVVGGTTRIPAIKELIKKVFHKEASTTLNADEAVARGCALQTAILSPTCRVRDFDIIDAQHYPIELTWQGFQEAGETDSLEVFAKYASIPASKMLTFYRNGPFTLHAAYHTNLLSNNKLDLGTYTVDKVVPTAKGEASKVKVKVRVNIHGLFSVASACMVEKVESDEAMEVDKEASGEAPMEQGEENEAGKKSEEAGKKVEEGGKKAEEGGKKSEGKKQKVKNIDLPIVAPSLSSKNINHLTELENEMVMQDKLEKERGEAKNAVEEYVYESRGKLGAEYEPFILPKAREDFLLKLDNTENWLYDEGENEKKQVYIDRLSSLKALGDPVKIRYDESLKRPQAFEKLAHALQMVGKSIEAFYNKDEQFNHLDEVEVEKVRKAVLEKQSWFEKHANLCANNPPHQDPPIFTTAIVSQLESLWNTCNPVMSKPKPKVEPPKEAPKKEETNNTSSNNNNNKEADNKDSKEDDKKTTPEPKGTAVDAADVADEKTPGMELD